MTQIGFVPFENIIGRADFIFLSYEQGARADEPGLRLGRIGMVVR